MQENEIGVIYPQINDIDCINCGKCQKICPLINPIDCKFPQLTYAAWSKDEYERSTSASGGIAAEIYKWAIKEKYIAIGAVINKDFSVSLQLANNIESIRPFKNSKYVFSSTTHVYPKINSLLKEEKKVLVIALPCQIAAIRKLFKEHRNLLLIDVVCHGTTPHSYLQQHIKMIEKQYANIAKHMSFRDPHAYTYTYTFTLYNANNQRFYAKRTKDGDTYQYGYHRAISYRENCYHCKFAKSERISDITLSDYKGLGTMAPCSFNDLKVSCILVNTENGRKCIDQLIAENRIVAQERPIQEPIQGDSQLRHPSVKTAARKEFEKAILHCNGNFEQAIIPVMKKNLFKTKIYNLIYNIPRYLLKKIVR